MPKASEIKKNVAVEHNGKVYLVKEVTKSAVCGRAGGSLYRIRMYEVATGANRTKGGQKAADLVQQARMQGYEGEACPECQNFTLVRNGTCLKCNTCGGTTGCS